MLLVFLLQEFLAKTLEEQESKLRDELAAEQEAYRVEVREFAARTLEQEEQKLKEQFEARCQKIRQEADSEISEVQQVCLISSDEMDGFLNAEFLIWPT